jgi:hypothetical protein
MKTRYIVGRYVGDTAWIGRYVNTDGVPESVVPTLIDLVLRHNVQETLSTILFKYEGWQALSSDLIPNYEEDQHVEGFGVPTEKALGWATWEDEDKHKAMFAYIFDVKNNSIEILCNHDNKWIPFDLVDYGPVLYRLNNRLSNIQEEVDKKWREHLVLT